MAIGVYKITNLINGHSYYGSTKGRDGFKGRWMNHKYALHKQLNRNAKLQCAWNKYGEHNFQFEVLEECPSEQCIEREQWYLDNCVRWGIDYNLRTIAESNIGNIKPDSIRTLVKQYGNVVSKSAAQHRIQKLGWELHKACSIPSKLNGHSFKDLVRKYHIVSYNGAQYRLKKLGWSMLKAATTPLQKVRVCPPY